MKRQEEWRDKRQMRCIASGRRRNRRRRGGGAAMHKRKRRRSASQRAACRAEGDRIGFCHRPRLWIDVGKSDYSNRRFHAKLFNMNNFGAHSILPGFRATFAIAVVRLAIMALLPLATPVVNTSTIGFEEASCRVVANGKAADKTACLKAADLGGTRWGGRGIDLSAASVPARACGEPADTAPEQNEEGPERRRNAA